MIKFLINGLNFSRIYVFPVAKDAATEPKITFVEKHFFSFSINADDHSIRTKHEDAFHALSLANFREFLPLSIDDGHAIMH